MTEGARVSLPFPAPGCSDFLSSPAAVSPDVGFLTRNVRFVSVAFHQAHGMGKVLKAKAVPLQAEGKSPQQERREDDRVRFMYWEKQPP